jgi:hypothetical protein
LLGEVRQELAALPAGDRVAAELAFRNFIKSAKTFAGTGKLRGSFARTLAGRAQALLRQLRHPPPVGRTLPGGPGGPNRSTPTVILSTGNPAP